MQTRADLRTARVVAAVAGLLGILLAVLTPFLPVKQTTAELNWPQDGTLASVTAPLIGYVPTDLTLSVPCRTAAGLTAANNVLLSTVPKQAAKAADRGLLIQRAGNDLVVVVRNTPVLTAPLSDVLNPACRELTVNARADAVSAEFVGLTGDGGAPREQSPLRGERGGDLRPQIVGIFTDLTGPAPPGLTFSATLDTRYSTGPTPLKLAVMLLGLACTLAALIALHILDTADGIRHRRILPARWWSLSALDGVVIAVLAWWHFVGANTSDDGYILTMARVSENAGYMANYYRWFGTPESPFGWYYDLLALWAHVSTASIWMRLPTLLMALACWWLISREVIPRLGVAVKHSRAAAWTAASMFLAFWLPLNNGLRPEPIIALGILATWCAVERGVATSRLLPVAIAGILGALTLFSGPTGIAAIGALLVAVGPLVAIVRRRSAQFGLLALLAPILAASTVTVILMFRDQTFAAVAQSSALKRMVGPSLTWFDEHIRYARLFLTTPDGAIARRFAVLALLLALAVVVAMMLRRGHIPGTATGPSRRIVGVTVISFLAMMLTPTKWTHHFGVFAGLAGALGALAAVAVTPHVLGSRRNRALFTAAALFVTALSFASVNGWWYVAGFGVPWADRMPELRLGFSTVLLGLSMLALLVAAWYQFSGRDHGRAPRWAISPLAVLAWLMVVFEVGSLTVGMVRQYPAFSVGRSNLQALTGTRCGLADDVLVESAPGMLRPAGGTVSAEGFSANAIPADVAAQPVTEPPAGGNTLDEETTDTAQAGDSRITLPFGLDPATPVLGSWRSGVQQPARLRTAWYRLPDREAAPLLVVTAAGRFDPGAITVEWATDQQAADEKAGGVVDVADIGPAPGWRNLRAPLSAIPAEATAVRVVAVDDDLAPSRWIAVTPPRAPALRTLQQEVGSSDPVLLDWLVGLAFPCQRPFGHANGVTEVPKWRILPGQFATEANSPVMDNLGGGPLGITELLVRADTVPTYLRDDWARDWGALQRLTLLDPGAVPARLDLGTATRSGLWSPAPLRPA